MALTIAEEERELKKHIMSLPKWGMTKLVRYYNEHSKQPPIKVFTSLEEARGRVQMVIAGELAMLAVRKSMETLAENKIQLTEAELRPHEDEKLLLKAKPRKPDREHHKLGFAIGPEIKKLIDLGWTNEEIWARLVELGATDQHKYYVRMVRTTYEKSKRTPVIN